MNNKRVLLIDKRGLLIDEGILIYILSFTSIIIYNLKIKYILVYKVNFKTTLVYSLSLIKRVIGLPLSLYSTLYWAGHRKRISQVICHVISLRTVIDYL